MLFKRIRIQFGDTAMRIHCFLAKVFERRRHQKDRQRDDKKAD